MAISPSDLFEQMGYGDTIPDQTVLNELTTIVEEVRTILRPRFSFVITDLKLQEEKGILGTDSPSTVFHIGKIISRQLKGSEAYALFVCTAGMEFENYQQQLKQENDMVRMFIADALGSVIAEKCADQMEITLQASIDKLGWKHTNRFSPGYCGWLVSEQQKLFPLISRLSPSFSHEIVSLTESSLMIPIKSVSGIIGLGKQVRHLDYTCGLCDLQQCYKRSKRVNRAP